MISSLIWLSNNQPDKYIKLNDEVINNFSAGLSERTKSNVDLPKMHVFRHFSAWRRTINSSIKWRTGRKTSSCSSWLDLVLYPLNINKNHWVLISITPLSKSITYFFRKVSRLFSQWWQPTPRKTPALPSRAQAVYIQSTEQELVRVE